MIKPFHNTNIFPIKMGLINFSQREITLRILSLMIVVYLIHSVFFNKMCVPKTPSTMNI